MTGADLFIDSSAWLGYLLGNIPKTKPLIESHENTLFTSILSIHEIYKRLKKIGKEPLEAITFIEENSIIINLNKDAAIIAADNCEKYGLPTIDSLIYTSAEELNATLVTADNDFRKAPNVMTLERD